MGCLFSEHSRGSLDPAIVFVVSVALEKVPKIIQTGSVGAELVTLSIGGEYLR